MISNLNLAGLVLALLFIALIFSKKDKQLRDYLLAFFIFILGTFLLIKYAFQNDLVNSFPVIIYLDIYYWVILGPALYIYTMVSTSGENHLRKSYLYTLIPALLVTICFSEYIFVNPIGLVTDEENIPFYVLVGYYIWLFNSPVFYILSILALRKHQWNIRNHYSFTKSVDLKWLYYLSNGFGIFILFLLVKILVRVLFKWEIPFDNYNISIIAATIYLFGIGFFGYKQKGIFDNAELKFTGHTDNIPDKLIDIKENKSEASYQKSGLNKDEAAFIENTLKNLMQNEQLYLDSELDLHALSKKVEVSTHKLSQVLNENLNKNFFDFVNEHRIQKVKELLSDPANNQYKIISLAYDSGFNSKSTFYKLFRKFEGITPAQFREKNKRKAG